MSDPAITQDLAARPAKLLPRRVGLMLAALAIIALPLIFPDTYWRTNLTICAINVLLALGLDFIIGYAGQLNLGHSAFYGLGAYVSTLLIVKLGVPFWVAFVGGVAFAGVAGMFLSLFAVRLRGHYLAIASLGFAVIIYQILLNWISLTQGPLGIYGIAPPPPICARRPNSHCCARRLCARTLAVCRPFQMYRSMCLGAPSSLSSDPTGLENRRS